MGFLCCPLVRRVPNRTLLLAAAGLLVLFTVLQVGRSWAYWDRRYRGSRGLYQVESSAGAPGADLLPGAGPTSSPGPSGSNVVYITLRSRRLRPGARSTARPTQRNQSHREDALTRASTPGSSRDHRDHLTADRTRGTAIRMYSETPPPWLSAQDVRAMRLLADAVVSRIREVSFMGSRSVLEFETPPGETDRTQPPGGRPCLQGRCGVLGDPGDPSQVFGFHLDRVLGLNRTLPTVSRRVGLLHGGQLCPVVWWDPSLYPEGFAADRSRMRLTWAEYQSSLKHHCWHGNQTPPPDSGCSSVHHQEWSRLALLDFLLQVPRRLGPVCCGFRPRQEEVCLGRGGAQCADLDHMVLNHILVRGQDPRRLVFTHNTGSFSRSEQQLDYRVLQGVQELPERAIEVLRSSKLRQRLLQSLFLDASYWWSQGGRRGMERLIDVIEGRAKLLLTFISAHGVKVIPMTSS